MRWLLSLDPGLDVVGYAVFDGQLAGRGGSIEDRWGPALVTWGRLVTATDAALAERLGALTVALGGLFWQPDPLKPGDYLLVPAQTAVVIEQPAAKAVYARNQRAGRDAAAAIHAGLEKLNLAIGALHAGAQMARAAEIHLLRTPRCPKGRKSAIAQGLLRVWARERHQEVPRTIQDERDSLFLGAFWLEGAASRARIDAVRAQAAGAGGRAAH